MKLNNYSLKGNFLFGLVKIVTVAVTIILTGWIVFLSSKYVNTNFVVGYLSGRPQESIEIVRWTLVIHSYAAALCILLSTPSIFFKTDQHLRWLHRSSGRIVLYIGVFILFPSAIVLTYFAYGAWFVKLPFYLLSVLYILFLIIGIQKAKWGLMLSHRKWMIRFYILLTSALWLRINMFVVIYSTGTLHDFQYFMAAILSWLPQIIIAEILFYKLLK